ncbi:DgyrCDS10026 [Dimorphilus gyrociliatus]|uniref:Actin-modulator n=1 Tax=Dimorphilus gyrociliatus TaxID=2664684 RepID=A0A7I8W073_9ANNE|nr:DgyrCDS10026 [Dimorphilus gyrociliatus]
MSIKAKSYNWKDTNLSLFGSDTEKKVKKESANQEPAWEGAGENVGLKVWRIMKFQVTDWPEEKYGEFFSGDSYIILNTFKDEESDALNYDVHFWIGKNSSQDEYGTAAYKTVELDTYLNDAAIQHREVQGVESSLFNSYFPSMIFNEGGVDSGFRRVEETEFIIRLYRIKSYGKTVKSFEIPLKKRYVTSDDVYVLDKGSDIYQWNGGSCRHNEKWKAAECVSRLKIGRSNVNIHNLEEGELDSEFFDVIEDDGEGEIDERDIENDLSDCGKALIRVSDAKGEMEMMEISRDEEISRSSLDSNDVFVVDVGDTVFIWIGKDASENESRNGFGYAHRYLQKTANPLRPITVISEGKKNDHFIASTNP